MSIELLTTNRGIVENFGFVSVDITRVHLSDDLPPISLPQFCDYSTQTLIELYESTDTQTSAKIKSFVEFIQREVQGLPTIPFEIPQFQTEVSSERLGELDRDFELRKTDRPPEINELTKKVFSGEITAEDHFRITAYYAEAAGYKISHYEENPFKIKDGMVEIGGLFITPPEHFAILTSQVLSGGLNGWSSVGVPECVAQNLQRIFDIVLKDKN